MDNVDGKKVYDKQDSHDSGSCYVRCICEDVAEFSSYTAVFFSNLSYKYCREQIMFDFFIR